LLNSIFLHVERQLLPENCWHGFDFAGATAAVSQSFVLEVVDEATSPAADRFPTRLLGTSEQTTCPPAYGERLALADR
jgi:hypothetical protein